MADRDDTSEAHDAMPADASETSWAQRNGAPHSDEFEALLDQLATVLVNPDISAWMTLHAISLLSVFRHNPRYWGLIRATYKKSSGLVYDLEKAVDHYRTTHDLDETPQHGLSPPETLTHLIADDIPPPKQLFEGLMHDGMLLFGGKSKRGKSWLIFDLAIALAVGRAGFRHFACPAPMPVLYLALEDGRARLQGRAKAIQPNLTMANDFHLRYSFPPLAHGGIEALHTEIARYRYGLVIIDVLAKLETSAAGKSERGYHDIYDMFAPLQELRKQHPFCLAMLTHLRKQEADDAFDAILGSVAYQGAQDVLWVLERKPKDDFAFLHIRDKDAEEKTIALRFTQGHWEYIGEGEEYEISRDQRKVIQFLAQEKTECSLEEVRKGCSFKDEQYGYLRKLLSTMVKDDLVHRAKHGKYSATIRGELEMGAVSEDNDSLPF